MKRGYLYHNASPHKTLWLQKVLEARNNDKLNWFLKCLNYHRTIKGDLFRRQPPRGWGLHQSADRGGQKGVDPSGNTLTKSQKVASEKGGSEKNGQSYYDDDTE